jgi:hypothetical protein
MAAAGTVLWTKNGEVEQTDCGTQEPCYSKTSTIPLAPMLVTQGASLLSIPLTYLLRGLGDDQQGAARIHVEAAGLRLLAPF